LRQAVIEAALQKPIPAVADAAQQPTSTEHYFIPVSPFQVNAKSDREVVHVASNAQQPAYVGKGAVHPFIPSKNGDKEGEENNGYSTDPHKIVQRGEGAVAQKGSNGTQHIENGSWKYLQDPSRKKMPGLHVPDLRPLSPPLILDYNSFDSTFDGTFDETYDDLLGMSSLYLTRSYLLAPLQFYWQSI
jgi:hypothetical protein